MSDLRPTNELAELALSLLCRSRDGLSTRSIARRLRLSAPRCRQVLYSLREVRRAYVDRWLPPEDGRVPMAVWCAGDHDDCPHPTAETKPKCPHCGHEIHTA